MKKNCVCDCHKKEISEWVKIVGVPSLEGFEVQKERHSLGIAFNNLKIPEGCELLEMQELIDLCNSKYAESFKLVTMNKYWAEYVNQPFNRDKGRRAAWLGCNSTDDSFFLDAGDCLGNGSAARGVRYKRKIKEDK